MGSQPQIHSNSMDHETAQLSLLLFFNTQTPKPTQHLGGWWLQRLRRASSLASTCSCIVYKGTTKPASTCL
jgi:hypothetical protein